MYALVFFLEENVFGPPTHLEEIQDMLGRNGMEADFKNNDFCMARYDVGGEMRNALIFELSDNLEELQNKYDEVEKKRKVMRQAQAPVNENRIWYYTKVIGGTLLAGYLLTSTVPRALALPAKVSANEIVRESLPSNMAIAAIANGGGYAVGCAREFIAEKLVDGEFTSTAKVVGTASLGLATNVMSFAADAISRL